jgi:hypothetical protein
MCRTYGAWRFAWVADPTLPRWANVCCTYGAWDDAAQSASEHMCRAYGARRLVYRLDHALPDGATSGAPTVLGMMQPEARQNTCGVPTVL